MKYKLNFTTASVVGVGISNTPLIGWLTDHGVAVTARDLKTRDKLEPLASELEVAGVRVICGEAYLDGITDEVIFRAPGIRYDKPQFRAAVARGVRLTSEMELFFELCPATIVGVTGSDGKTTTTTIISRLLEAEYGREHVWVGGNIGIPLLPEVERMTEDDWAVVELSSFQLHTMRRSPKISVITNVTPNHLDYHIDMVEYTDAKRRIYRNQCPGDRVVLNGENDITRSMISDAAITGTEVVTFGRSAACADGVLERDGEIFCHGQPVLKTSEIKIPGHHNVENYMAAIGALWGRVKPERFAELAREFGGVEHRIEFVLERGGVRFYNSSIDSSPTRTIAALESFPPSENGRYLVVICGGYDKHIPYEPLAAPLCRTAKAVVLTGATAGRIKAALVKSPEYRENPPKLFEESTFEKAVRRAAAVAASGDVVLLSPASASFDSFKNFEERGRRFKELVRDAK